MPTPVPDLIEPIVAYRAWRYSIDERGARIFALGGHEDAWDGARVAGGWSLHARGSRPPTRSWLRRRHTPLPRRVVRAGSTRSQVDRRRHGDPRDGVVCPVTRRRRTTWDPYQGVSIGRARCSDGSNSRGRWSSTGSGAERSARGSWIRSRWDPDDHAIASLALRLQVPLAAPIDEGSIDRAVEAFNAAFGGPLQMPRRGRPLSLFERLRLLTHQRLFRVIQGGAASSESS